MIAKLQEIGPTTKSELPPFAALRAIDALVRLGGVRKAAQHLGLHHSVISRHLSLLESWLGAPLLTWTGKRFALTAQGERFHARIAMALAEIALATREVLDEEAARPVKLWCSQGLSIQWLAGQVTEFEKEHPAIRVEIRPSDGPADLLVHEADINIFMQLDSEIAVGVGPGLKAMTLARPVSMIAASPDIARQLEWIGSAADLLKAPLLHCRHTNDWRWWLTENHVVVPEQLPGELCWHPFMALEAARLGRGIVLGNRFFFQSNLARGDLVELNVPGTTNSPFGGYTFVAREDRWSVSGIATLRRFLADRMKVMERI